MEGRVALVTGGTGAIGSEICRDLYRAHYQVVASSHSLDQEHAQQWHDRLRKEGFDLGIVLCDVRDFADTAAAVKRIEHEVGPIDVLVNAAGITRDATLRKMTPEAWEEVIRTNLDSVFNTTRNVIEGMLERGFGRIINISSINGQRGQFGQTNYSAAKAGLHGFTMALAREVARKGITVNTVSPGYIHSPMIMKVPENIREQIKEQIPVGRFGYPEDVARVITFLADEHAGFITGANIPVNGGHHIY